MSLSPEVFKRAVQILGTVWKPDYDIFEDLADDVVRSLNEEGLSFAESDVQGLVKDWWRDCWKHCDETLPADKHPVTTEARVQLEEYGIHIDGDVKRLLSILEKVELCETQNEKTLPQGVSLTQYSRVILDVCFRLTGN